jgi:hypothetical protein
MPGVLAVKVRVLACIPAAVGLPRNHKAEPVNAGRLVIIGIGEDRGLLPDTSRRTAMGHPDGAHTHGSGSDPVPVLIVIGAAVIAGPAAAAVAAIAHALAIIAAALLGLGAAALAAVAAWRLHRWRHPGAARVTALPPGSAQAAQALPPQQQTAIEQPQAQAIESGGQVHIHHHWHGITAEDVAEILRREQ